MKTSQIILNNTTLITIPLVNNQQNIDSHP
jgi:hypothetical protein